VNGLQYFAYAISHDLKTTLHTLSGYIGLLKRSVSKQSNQEIDNYLDELTKAIQQTQAFLESTLHYATLPHLKVKMAPVPLNGLIEEVLQAGAQRSKRSVHVLK